MSWTCSKCGEVHKDIYDRCWNCKAPKPGFAESSTRSTEANPPVAATAALVTVSSPRYRYEVVPFIGTIRTGFFSSDNAQTVSVQLQSVIEQYAQRGWEFYSVEKVDIKVESGCIGQLLGQNASYITFDQLIFRRTTAT